MERLLRDGGDLDSMDRSLLDCELNNEKCLNQCTRVDKLSADPGKLSIDTPIANRTNHSKETMIPKSANPPEKADIKAVPPKISSDKSCSADTERTPLFSGKKDTIVKFSASSHTMVVATKDTPVQLDVSGLCAATPSSGGKEGR